MLCAWIESRWRRRVIHLRMHLRWVLSAIFVTVTNDLFSLIVEPRMLLCAWIIKTIRPKENLVLSFIIGSPVWTTTSLSVTSTSHDHWWLTCWNARTKLLTSIILFVLRVNLIIAIAQTLVRWWLLIRIFAHYGASDKSFLVDGMILRILSLAIVILGRWTTIMSLLIPSICTISLPLSASIKVLSSASILGHIKSVFNAWRPLSLSVSHWKVRISWGYIWFWALISLTLIISIIFFSWRRSSS